MMKPVILAATVLACAAGQCAPAGDPGAGQAKSATCAACHGADGNSVNPEWPSIAGQHPEYIIAQLRAYQDGTRPDPMMAPMAMNLSEQDMQDLAAYYAGQAASGGEADPDLVARGEAVYRGGNAGAGVAACIACHGPRGMGNGPAGWPRIAGQHATYIAGELREYRSGNRRTDAESIMRDVTRRMTDDEIEAVASYVQGLR